MSESMKNDKRAGLSRRDFLSGAAVLVGSTAAATALASVAPATAIAEEAGVIGDWAADGSKNVTVPSSAATNASASDGTFRDHNAAAFPANDATPIPPRAVPSKWDYECEICVVGGGGGGLNAAARTPAGRGYHLRGGHGLTRWQRAVCGYVRDPGRFQATGIQALCFS